MIATLCIIGYIITAYLSICYFYTSRSVDAREICVVIGVLWPISLTFCVIALLISMLRPMHEKILDFMESRH